MIRYRGNKADKKLAIKPTFSSRSFLPNIYSTMKIFSESLFFCLPKRTWELALGVA